MIIHCLGCLIKNTPVSFFWSKEIPSRDYPVGTLIHNNAYAYFIFDIEMDDKGPVSIPFNYSPFTFLGGTVYELETAKKKFSNSKRLTEYLNLYSSKYVIHTSNDTILPFNEDDVLINIFN